MRADSQGAQNRHPSVSPVQQIQREAGRTVLPLLIRVENTQTGEVSDHAFTTTPVRIGRNELNDLVLREPFISQWHAVVWFDAERGRYVDLGSTNGTRVAGRRVEKNVEVELHTDIDLCIGPLRLRFARAPGAEGSRYVRPRATSFHIDQTENSEVSKRTMFLNAASAAQVAPSQSVRASASIPVVGYAESATHTAVVEALEPLYAAYRSAWHDFAQEFQRQIDGLPPQKKKAAILALAERFPDMGKERELRTIARKAGVFASELGEVDAEEWLARLGVPNTSRHGETVRGTALAMERAGAVLEAVCQAYIELRKGYAQFGTDMALSTPQDGSPLHRAESGAQILAYLLDWRTDGNERVNELTRAFAELAIHQVALLNGVMEGIRSLLQRLSPREVAGITADAGSTSDALTYAPGTGVLGWLFPFRASSLWRKYVSRHRSFVEEDRFTREVFGRSFARAYYMVTGSQVQGSSGPATGRYAKQ